MAQLPASCTLGCHDRIRRLRSRLPAHLLEFCRQRQFDRPRAQLCPQCHRISKRPHRVVHRDREGTRFGRTCSSIRRSSTGYMTVESYKLDKLLYHIYKRYIENWSGRIENVEMNWPRRPEIEFSEVKLSYTGNLDNCALNGVSFKVNAGEKIGICGRTGSGKSSLLMALFRAVELCEGSILIDGLNIRDLNLKDLRERLVFISFILFKGCLLLN